MLFHSKSFEVTKDTHKKKTQPVVFEESGVIEAARTVSEMNKMISKFGHLDIQTYSPRRRFK